MAAEQHTHPTLLESIADCNHRLDCVLKRRYGVSFRTYKIIVALTRLIAVIGGIAALADGADPTTTVIVVGVIASGPDVAEALIANANDGD